MKRFLAAVHEISEFLAKAIAADGEGASRMIEVDLKGADTEETARLCARSVVSSSLVKAAVHGATPLGQSAVRHGVFRSSFDQGTVDVAFSSDEGHIDVFLQGVPVNFDEDRALKILSRDVIHIEIDMHQGDVSAKAWGCDLTKEYVAINGDYRS